MKAFCVAVHPNTNCSYEYLVMADDAKSAVNKLNFLLRKEKKALIEKYPKDEYNIVSRVSDAINALRRTGRSYKDRFAACFYKPVHVYELPNTQVYSVSYFTLGSGLGYVSNLLPEIPMSAAQDSQEK